MASKAWAQVERTVAAILGGVRSWQTDHDVLVVTAARPGVWPEPGINGHQLLAMSRLGAVTLASVECKNLKAPTVAALELFLIKNRQKADRDGVAESALVIKRKAGSGRPTPYLFMQIIEPPADIEAAIAAQEDGS